MSKTLKQLFDESLKKWGMPSQILMMAEESSELSVAALHLLRTIKDKEESLLEFADEMADVQFMLDEMVYYFKEQQVKGKSFFDWLVHFRKEKEKRLDMFLSEVSSQESGLEVSER